MGENEVNIGESGVPPQKFWPTPPQLPGPGLASFYKNGLSKQGSAIRGYKVVSTPTRDLLERLFDEGYEADVKIHTDHGCILYAHASILGLASSVIRSLLKKSKKHGRWRSISIRGVPPDAVRVFIWFLYSSCHESEEVDEYVLPLLVLSHVYVVPQLKRLCEVKLEKGLLNLENVVDIFQLSLLCDAPRLSLICHRMIVKNFKDVSSTDGWNAMGQSHPKLEKQLLDSVNQEENRQKQRTRKLKERKIYLQLYEAMEALIHICREGCRTIGPSDKVFKEDQPPCTFEACKGLELLIRHFAGCKMRVPGSCIHCKRMWQLLDLHSRLCADSNICRVPLCRNFKDRRRKQTKKDEIKWKILVRNILRSKGIGLSPIFTT